MGAAASYTYFSNLRLWMCLVGVCMIQRLGWVILYNYTYVYKCMPIFAKCSLFLYVLHVATCMLGGVSHCVATLCYTADYALTVLDALKCCSMYYIGYVIFVTGSGIYVSIQKPMMC